MPSSSADRDSRTLRAGSVQFQSAAGDKEANFRKIESFAAEASAEAKTKR